MLHDLGVLRILLRNRRILGATSLVVGASSRREAIHDTRQSCRLHPSCVEVVVLHTEGWYCIFDVTMAMAVVASEACLHPFNFDYRIFELLKILVNFYFVEMHNSSL